MIDVKPDVKTELDIVVKPRLNILYMVIYELAEKFGASSGALETIKKGILEKQYIKKIILRYYNDKKEIVGEIYFDIDWAKYEINAADDKGAEFKINCKKSTYSQISEIGEEIVKYVDKMRKDLAVVDIGVWYNFIISKHDDEEQYKAIQEFLGTKEGTEKASYNMSSEFKHNFEMVFGMLDELTIGIKRN